MELRTSNSAYKVSTQDAKGLPRDRLRGRKLRQSSQKKNELAKSGRQRKIVKARKCIKKQNPIVSQANKELRMQLVTHSMNAKMKMIEDRVDRIEKEKKNYQLTGFQRQNHEVEFTIIKKKDQEKTYKIILNENFQMTCNCLDWVFRCSAMGVACKHI